MQQLRHIYRNRKGDKDFAFLLYKEGWVVMTFLDYTNFLDIEHYVNR